MSGTLATGPNISTDPPIGVTDHARHSATEVHLQSPPQWCQTRPNRSGSGSLLQVPSERYGSATGKRTSIKVTDILFEEETEVIRNCGALSSAVLGLMKSFSTSDICSLNDSSAHSSNLRQTLSEIALFGGMAWNPRLDLPNIRRLDCTSRSCSTWVAVGDPVSSTSQLPSPQAQPGLYAESPTITAIDFVRSVNKKVRQMYIRRRLLSTYRAMGRLSRSQMNLQETGKGVSSPPTSEITSGSTLLPHIAMHDSNSVKSVCSSFDLANLCFKTVSGSLCLTAKDIERDKGKPLTKYERNIMIFNWLQNLDEGDVC